MHSFPPRVKDWTGNMPGTSKPTDALRASWTRITVGVKNVVQRSLNPTELYLRLCPGLGTQTCLGRVDSPMLGVLLDCSITCKSTHRMVLVGPCPGCTQLRCIQIGRFGRVDSPQFKVHSPQSIFDRPYSVPRTQTGWTCCGKLGSKSLYRSSVAGKECAVWSNQSVGAPCPLWLVRVIRKDSHGPWRRQGQGWGGLAIVLQWHKLQRCHAQSSDEPGHLIPKPWFGSRFATSGVGVRQRGCQQWLFQAVQVDCGDKAVHSSKSRFNEYKHFGGQSFLAGGDAVRHGVKREAAQWRWSFWHVQSSFKYTLHWSLWCFHHYHFLKLKFCWQVVTLVGQQQIWHRAMLGRKSQFRHACLKIFWLVETATQYIFVYIYIYIYM